MTTYTTNDFEGMWPVGSAAIVQAHSIEQARELLDVELEKRGLRQDPKFPYTLKEMPQEGPCVVVLCDGDY